MATASRCRKPGCRTTPRRRTGRDRYEVVSVIALPQALPFKHQRKIVLMTAHSIAINVPEKALSLDCLVVDDDPTIRLCVEQMIRDAGHHASPASDGASALALVTDHRY